ncbi:B12-binding domain-containing radical SAM protein, partial [Thermodesulfobacteriota bacterium]
MARIVLISMYDRLTIGLGHLSSFLKSRGHETHVVYFKRYEVIKPGRLREYNRHEHHVMVLNSGSEIVLCYARPPSRKEIAMLQDLVGGIGPDLVGLSFRTIAAGAAATITEAISREPGVPVIQGGIHPTIEPEGSIETCDVVCLGEGEYPLAELADAVESGADRSSIRNLWVRCGGEVVRNPVRPLIQDLDALPFPDYLPEGKYLVDGEGIREGISIKDFNGVYEIMTSRGCPFSCDFCCNGQLREILSGSGGKYLRRRSPANVIGELVEAKERFEIKYVNFQDDVFTFGREWLAEFTGEYKKRIGIPFWCYHHPNYTDSASLRLLKECGVEHMTMGIQSGSERVLKEVYNRHTSREKMLAAARMLDELEIDYNIDIITNNPFEAEQDCVETLELLLAMRAPVRFNGGLSKLTTYPATKIAARMEEQGGRSLLEEGTFDFYNLLYLLCQTKLPRDWIRGFSKNAFLRRHPSLLRG